MLNLLSLIKQKAGQMEILSILYMYKFVCVLYIYNAYISMGKIDVQFQAQLDIKQKWQMVSNKEETKKSGRIIYVKGNKHME